ncbi:MAG: hypothetical protein AAGE61_15925 [Pseudomonadota bacterium]
MLRVKKGAAFAILALIATGFTGTSGFANPAASSLREVEDTSRVQKAALPSKKAKALKQLFDEDVSPKGFRFCGVDQKTGECKGKSGMRGAGLGGTLLPLVLEIKSVKILERSRQDGKLSLKSKFKASVNGIPPACARTTGTITLSASEPAELNYKNFYCNWLGIGNVLTKVKLTIEDVDLEGRRFSGKYNVRFNGTGNVFGTGRFIAFAR